MKKLILLATLISALFSNDLIYVEKEKLDTGFWKGLPYTGNIDIDGNPQGEGTVFSNDDFNEERVKGLFKNGSLIKGKIDFGKRPSFSGETYYFSAEGEVAGDFYFQKGSKVFLDMTKKTKEIMHVESISGTIFYQKYNQMHINSITTYSKMNPANLKLRKCKLKIYQPYKQDTSLRDLNDCKKGPYYQEWFDGLKYEGFITDDYKQDKTYDGTLTWPNGATYSYKGEWIGSNKRAKIKKRLDIVNKRKAKSTPTETKKDTVTSNNQPVKELKQIQDENTQKIVVEKNPVNAKVDASAELKPINME